MKVGFIMAGVGMLMFVAWADSAQGDLVNGGFESPDTGPLPSVTFIDQSLVPAWQTTASSGLIEIWSNNFNGVPAYEGSQHAELNSDEASILYQDMTGIAAGQSLAFQFAHRARIGTDVLTLTITDLGIDGVAGGGNDTVLFSKNYSASATGWTIHSSSGEPVFQSLGNNIRFAFTAVSSGSGDLTSGNFLDGVEFSTSVVPEPSLTAVCGFFGLAISLRRRRKTIGDQTHG